MSVFFSINISKYLHNFIFRIKKDDVSPTGKLRIIWPSTNAGRYPSWNNGYMQLLRNF